MRAREFITEQRAKLPPEDGDPMRYTYTIPSLKTSDPYQTYRFGVALARARAEQDPDAVFDENWTSETAFSNEAIVAGFNDKIDLVIDRGLEMIGHPTTKVLVGTGRSEEPDFVDTQSPINAFKGYPR